MSLFPVQSPNGQHFFLFLGDKREKEKRDKNEFYAVPDKRTRWSADFLLAQAPEARPTAEPKACSQECLADRKTCPYQQITPAWNLPAKRNVATGQKHSNKWNLWGTRSTDSIRGWIVWREKKERNGADLGCRSNKTWAVWGRVYRNWSLPFSLFGKLCTFLFGGKGSPSPILRVEGPIHESLRGWIRISSGKWHAQRKEEICRKLQRC